MPITKSAKKALKQSKKRRSLNLRRLHAMRENVKKIKKLVEEKQKEEARKLLPQTYKSIDKAAKRKIIKKNTASRKKSRITKLVNRTEIKKAEPASSADESKDSQPTIQEQS